MEQQFRLGDWRVEPSRNVIVRGDAQVRLDPRVMQVLVCLAEEPGEIVSQERIIDKVWAGAFVTDGVLTNAIWELRKALGDDSTNPRFIQTVPKKGYRLVAEVRALEAGQRSPPRWLLAALAAVVAAIGGYFLWSSLRPANSSRPARFALRLPESQGLAGWPAFAISPDGSRIVYLAAEGGRRQSLFVRAVEEFTAAPLRGTEGASNPFFSPDGEWVGFHSFGKLRKVAVGGGEPIPIADALESFGATWGEDDTIVFVQSRLTGLYRVKSTGGAPQEVFRALETEMAWFPQFVPGGREVLFTLSNTVNYKDQPQVVALSLKTGERRNLLEGHSPRYAATGHLLYARTGTGNVFAVPFDRKRLEIHGQAVPVLENVAWDFARGAPLALSENGTLVYVAGYDPVAEKRALVLVDRHGNVRPLNEPGRHYDDPRFSPDGTRIAFASEGDIWTRHLESGRVNRLTFTQESRLPVWSPDGEQLAFRSWNIPERLFVIAADGSLREELLTSGPGELLPGSWSSRGEIVFEWDTPEAQMLHVLPLHGTRKPESLRTTGLGAELSPDGRYLAYAWGRPREIYVQRFPEGGGKWQVSSGGGNNPVWGPDGREIFYQAVPQLTRIMVVSVETAPAFSAGAPRLLFEYPELAPSGLSGFPNYDISPDGQTFVMVKRPPPVTEFNVVLNWHEELRRLVPVN